MKKSIIIISALDIWSMGKLVGAQSLWQTIKAYADNDWKVFFITSNKNEKSATIDHDNIEIIRFDSPLLKKCLKHKSLNFIINYLFWVYFQLHSYFIIKKIIKNYTINILYGYEIHAVPIAYYLSKKNNITCISRFQGTVLNVNDLSNVSFFSTKWLHIFAMKLKADLTIMTNDGTQGDKVLLALERKENEFVFWKNGVHLYDFKDVKHKNILKKYNIPDDKFVFVSVSRLVNWKRIDRSITALKKVRESKEQFHFIIVGDGSEKTKLMNLSEELDMDKHITFTGSLEHYDAQKLIYIADIFLSMYDLSNLGNPLFEALSLGKPIITINNGDTGKVITNNENGILLDVNEINLLPEKILELMENKEMRENLSRNALEYCKSNIWTWQQRMETEVDLVNSIL